MFDNVLVPTDGSACAEMASEYARNLATKYEATVHALCVADSRRLENAPQYERIKKNGANPPNKLVLNSPLPDSPRIRPSGLTFPTRPSSNTRQIKKSI
ncbi:UspA domain-containing protein [Halococcus thailandensis JCM 13552]|uniref:UspA domain-containing protein n=1 Tax=Halococcus thailandensis JCM 13552 TaxID=1227457 RepID=M0NE28_9EURY|nr:UspA domain-containing protein [Halococcus thailandensis JCM 13552]